MSGKKTIGLLQAMGELQTLLTTIELAEAKALQPGAGRLEGFNKVITLHHASLRLKLFVDRKLPKQESHSPSLYLQVTFEIHEDELLYTGIYCEHREREAEITQLIQNLQPPGGFRWNPEQGVIPYSDKVKQYLDTADSIAMQAYQCDAGDDYWPGYYSEIVLEEASIQLKQINHWNARSIDHRDDYVMRNLEFDIPLRPVTVRPSFLTETIGDMQVYFFDRSSDKNRACGERITEQIQLAKQRYSERPT